MPAMTPIQFASQSYQARSSNVSSERMINLYLEANPQGAKSPTVLYGTPGLRKWITVGDGPVRGMIQLGPRLFVVSGPLLYAVDHSGSIVEIGPIEGAGNVHLTANATHIAIVTPGKSYAANADGIVELPEGNLNGATYLNGKGVFTQSGGQKFWITAIDDMTSIDALDFSTADAQPGAMRGCIEDHQRLWLFTENSIEIWYDSGASGFPFERDGSSSIEKGCMAPGTPSKAEHNVLWLGHDKSVYMGAGGAAKSISAPSIHRLIGETPDPASAWAFTYKQEEHVFYVLNFSDLTLCYDMTTGLWHERRSDGMGRWRANCYSDSWGRHLVGDCIDGRIYELDLDYFTDDGDIITRQSVAPPSHGSGGKVCYHELFVDIEAGVATQLGQGANPAAMLDWSSDGGHTWSSTVQSRMGKIGEYGHRLQWNRLGTSPQRHFRMTITDPVKVAILAAYVRAEAR